MNPIWLNAVLASQGVAVVPWYLAGGAPMPVAAYQPIGAASLAASLLDISGTGNHATTATAPSFSSLAGWQFLGTGAAVVNTPIVPLVGYTVIAFFEIFGTGGAGAGRLVDNTGGGIQGLRIVPNNNGTNVSYLAGVTALLVAPPIPNITPSTLCIAGSRVYRNGVDEGGLATGAFGAGVIGIGNVVGVRELFGDVKAVAIYSSTLTAPQVAAVSAAMAALT